MIFSLEYIKQITSPDFLLHSHADAVMTQIDRMGLRYEYEERAAILEYDGGLSRDEADKRAFREIVEKIDRMKK